MILEKDADLVKKRSRQFFEEIGMCLRPFIDKALRHSVFGLKHNLFVDGMAVANQMHNRALLQGE